MDTNKNIDTSTKRAKNYAIISTIAFVVGIPMIPISALNENYIIMALGIALTVGGFYSMPFLWLHYARLNICKKLYYSITKNNIRDLNTLCQVYSMSPKMITQNVNYLVKHGYIDHFEFETSQQKKQEIILDNKCPNCNAPMRETDSQKNTNYYECDYCHGQFKKILE